MKGAAVKRDWRTGADGNSTEVGLETGGVSGDAFAATAKSVQTTRRQLRFRNAPELRNMKGPLRGVARTERA
jgi:hypothetical protein